MTDWFFGNPVEEQRRRKYKEEAANGLKEHLRRSSLAPGQNQDLLASNQVWFQAEKHLNLKASQEKPNPLLGIGERQANNRPRAQPSIHENILQPKKTVNDSNDRLEPKRNVTAKNDMEESPRRDHYEDQPTGKDSWDSDENKLVLRKLKSLLEREDYIDRLEQRLRPRRVVQRRRRTDSYDYDDYDDHDDYEEDDRYVTSSRRRKPKHQEISVRSSREQLRNSDGVIQKSNSTKKQEDDGQQFTRGANDTRLTKQQQYQRELEEQIRLKKEREAQEKQRRIEEDRAKEKEMYSYDPFRKNYQEHVSKFAPRPSVAKASPDNRYQLPAIGNNSITSAPVEYQNMDPTLNSNNRLSARMDEVAQPSGPVQNPLTHLPPLPEKTFLRGAVDVDKMPQWQKQQMLQKQMQTQTVQDILARQILERKELKKMEIERQRQEERLELERIEKERIDLENKFKAERQQEKVIALNKESETKNDLNIRENVKTSVKQENTSTKTAKEIAEEKFLQAQREAEEMKRNKFKAKRAHKDQEQPQNEEKAPENRSSSPPIPTLQGKVKKSSDHLPKLESRMMKNPSNVEQGISENAASLKPRPSSCKRESILKPATVKKYVEDDSKTSEILEQLRSLKLELERDRRAMKEEMFMFKHLSQARYPNVPLQMYTVDKPRNVMVHDSFNDLSAGGFSGKQIRNLDHNLVNTRPLMSISTHVPLDGMPMHDFSERSDRFHAESLHDLVTLEHL